MSQAVIGSDGERNIAAADLDRGEFLLRCRGLPGGLLYAWAGVCLEVKQ